MIDPPRPASIIAGMQTDVVFQTPVRFVAMTSSHCCWEIFQLSGPNGLIPALALTMSTWPNSSRPASRRGLQARPVPDVGLPRDDALTGLLHERDGLVQLLGLGLPIRHPGYASGESTSTAMMSAPSSASRTACERP